MYGTRLFHYNLMAVLQQQNNLKEYLNTCFKANRKEHQNYSSMRAFLFCSIAEKHSYARVRLQITATLTASYLQLTYRNTFVLMS